MIQRELFSRRMTTVLLLVLVSFLGTGSATAQEEAPLKIAVVSLDTVVASSPMGAALNTRLELLRSAAQTEAKALNAEIEAISARLVNEVASLANDEVAELRRQVQTKSEALGRYQIEKNAEAQRIQAEGLKEIEKQLEPIVKAIASERGFDLILNAVPGVVVMASDRVDITDAVVARLQAGG